MMTISSRDLGEFWYEMNHCSTVDQCWELFLSELHKHNFPHVIYGYSIGPYNTEETKLYWKGNYPSQFMDYYLKDNNYFYDESVWWCYKYTEINDWLVEVSGDCPDPAKALELDDNCRNMGIDCGFSVPARYPNNNVYGGVGISATGIEREDYNLNYRPKIPYIQNIVYMFVERCHMLQKFPVFTNQQHTFIPRLSELEKSLLKEEANGAPRKVYAEKFHFRDSKLLTPIFKELQARFKVRSIEQLIDFLKKMEVI